MLKKHSLKEELGPEPKDIHSEEYMDWVKAHYPDGTEITMWHMLTIPCEKCLRAKFPDIKKLD